MKLVALLLYSFFAAQEIPLKPKEEFEVKLDYQFRVRPAVDVNSVNLSETRQEYERRTASAPLPYLGLQFKLLKLSDEERRIRVVNNFNKVLISRKVEEGSSFVIDMGFTDDVKDRVTAHEYVVLLLSPDKRETSKIVVNVDEDGIFYVNGEKRGKF